MIDYSFENFLNKANEGAKNHAIGLSKENLFSRLDQHRSEASNWSLLWGLTSCPSSFFDTLWKLGQDSGVLRFLERIHVGEKVNSFDVDISSENRGVFHLAARSFAVSDHSEVERERLFAVHERERIASYLERSSWTALLVVGIGGSHLGLEALWFAFSSMMTPMRKVYFLSSCDPSEMQMVLRDLNLTTTLVAIISKSGSTEEVLLNESILRIHFKKEGLIPRKHFIALTMPETGLDDKDRFHERFYFSQGIGGRFCASSSPGALVIGFSFGMAVFLRFLKGANTMDSIALSSDHSKNIPLVMALLSVWNRNILQIPSTCVLPYVYGLRYFTAHLQQLAMESNGKRISKKGIAISYDTSTLFWGTSGTNFQHSFGQWLHQATDMSSMEIICVRGKETPSIKLLLSNAFGQALALAQGKQDENPNKVCLGNRPVLLLMASEFSCESLGELWSLYEHRVMFEGHLWNINSFDQEGVQLGKEMARKLTITKSDIQRFFEENFLLQ